MIPKNAIVFIILNSFLSKTDSCIFSIIKPIINNSKDIVNEPKPITNSIYIHLQSDYLQQFKEPRSKNAKLMSYKNNYIISAPSFNFSEDFGLI